MALSGPVIVALILSLVTVLFIIFIVCGAWLFLCWFDNEESKKKQSVKRFEFFYDEF